MSLWGSNTTSNGLTNWASSSEYKSSRTKKRIRTERLSMSISSLIAWTTDPISSLRPPSSELSRYTFSKSKHHPLLWPSQPPPWSSIPQLAVFNSGEANQAFYRSCNPKKCHFHRKNIQGLHRCSVKIARYFLSSKEVCFYWNSRSGYYQRTIQICRKRS